MADFEGEDEFDQMLARARAETEAARRGHPEAPTVIQRRPEPPTRTRSPQDEDQLDQYGKFLEALKLGKHPDHCELHWEPPNFFTRFTVKFEGDVVYPGTGERPDREERIRAYEYFSCYTPTERLMFSFIVLIQKGIPVTARVSVRSGLPDILRPPGTTRFQELSTPAWYKPQK